MRLFELAYCCRLYEQVTGFDGSLDPLRKVVGGAFDPWKDDHCAALFRWLNAWGCRQFAKEHHATTATTALREWASSWFADLPPVEANLNDVPRRHLVRVSNAYDALRQARASMRRLRSDRLSPVTFGPTGAAKALFAMRPYLVPPWDDPIRVKLGYVGASEGFLSYLTDVAESLQIVSSEAGCEIAELPTVVGRPLSTPPKLIDEYNWVVHTLGYQPPDAETLERWLNWARKTNIGAKGSNQ